MNPPRTLATTRHTASRSGMSLLEIIVALAVLTGTAAILAQMVSLAARHAERAQQITQAQTVAHNIMNELLAGMRDWESSETFQPVDSWTPWDYQLRIEPLQFANLAVVTVTVAERQDTEQQSTEEQLADQTQIDSPRHFRLTRWIHAKSTGYSESADGFDRPLEAERER